jgi:hypothetical protein
MPRALARTVQLRSRTYLSPNTVGNTSSFGSHRFRKRLLATIFSNVNMFGAHSIASAAKKYSYSNTLGTGDRRSTITVTTSGGSSSGTVANLVDGTTSGNPFFSGGVTFTFDLGSAKVIKQVRWKQTNSTAHGLYKWQGSNDDSSYTDIGGAFTLGGATVNIHQTLINNETAYRYYKLTPTTGSMSASPDIQEVEFFIEGSTSDQPDTCYLYPCGGGVNAGGQSSGTGGNGRRLVRPLTGRGEIRAGALSLPLRELIDASLALRHLGCRVRSPDTAHTPVPGRKQCWLWSHCSVRREASELAAT